MAEINDFVKATRIWMSIQTFLGLSCVTQDGDKTYKISYYKILHSALLCVFLCIFIYYPFVTFTYYKTDLVAIVLRCCIYWSGDGTSIILLMLLIKNAKCTAELLSDIVRFNRKYKWDQDIDTSMRLFYSFAASGLMVFSNICGDYLQFIRYVTDLDLETFIKFFAFGYVFPVSMFLMVGQVCFEVKWLDIYIERIIEILQTLDSPKNDSSDKITFKKIPFQERQDEHETQKLIELRSIYHEIYEIFKKMEKINSDRFILTIGQSFITATSYMYCALVYMAKPILFDKETNIITSSGFFRWSVSSSFAVLTLVYPCQYVADKGKEVVSAALVLRIKTDKPKLKNELENFMVQLTEEKIEFSPRNFFTMNNRLLLSLLGAAASYLIILIQSSVPIE